MNTPVCAGIEIEMIQTLAVIEYKAWLAQKNKHLLKSLISAWKMLFFYIAHHFIKQANIQTDKKQFQICFCRWRKQSTHSWLISKWSTFNNIAGSKQPTIYSPPLTYIQWTCNDLCTLRFWQSHFLWAKTASETNTEMVSNDTDREPVMLGAWCVSDLWMTACSKCVKIARYCCIFTCVLLAKHGQAWQWRFMCEEHCIGEGILLWGLWYRAPCSNGLSCV